jgi:hypothetical protein
MIEFYNQNQYCCYPLRPNQAIPDDIVVDARFRVPRAYADARIAGLQTGDLVSICLASGTTDLLVATGRYTGEYTALGFQPLVPGVQGSLVLGPGSTKPGSYTDIELGSDAVVVITANHVTGLNGLTSVPELRLNGISAEVLGNTITLSPDTRFSRALRGIKYHRPPGLKTINGVGPAEDGSITFVFN